MIIGRIGPAPWLALAALLLVVPASAQTPGAATVAGIVLDDGSGEPLPGANVLLSSTDFRTGAAADDDGRFVIANVRPGLYRVEVSFIGFRSFVRDSVRVAASKTTDLLIRLVSTGVMVNPITVTGSRHAERLLDAPASVTVLEARQLNARSVLTAAEHLKDVPGLDLVTTGLVSSRVVIRGFNDNLASSLLTLVDHRIARVPSVRLTALQLIPVSGGDIDQIEVVSGPASSMYGPNAANGVVHLLTRGPFESKGTTISLAGGERSVRLASIRHAGTVGERLGYKITAQSYSGTDFEFFDPEELAARNAAVASGALEDTLRVGARDFDVDNLAFSARVDYRFRPDLTVILDAGMTRGTNIEITPTGAAQVVGAKYTYLQSRLQYRNLFVQAYGNFIDSGESYFLRTGERFLDQSRLWVAQAQHFSKLGPRQRFTYGIDLFRTLPQGSGTVNGRNEHDDESTEVGAYVQSDTDLHRRLSLSLAARLDHHNRLENLAFSPRAALVFKPAPAHTFRFTYNRAFQTPKTNDLFSDLIGRRDLFQLGGLESVYGFAPSTDLRVQGMKDGFHFQTGPGDANQFRSPFAPLMGLAPSDWIGFDDAGFTDVMWSVARFATVAGLADNLAASGAIDPESAASVSEALDQILPTDVDGVHQELRVLDLDAQQFVAIDRATDFGRLGVTRTETVETGYRGLLFGGLLVSVDAYWTRVRDFLGPFVVGTPNVFLEPLSLSASLRPSIAAALEDPANAEHAAALQQLDTIPFLGNGNGTPVEEIAALVATGIAGAIPFGTVSPEEAYDPTAVLLMRRNFGDLSVYGMDTGITLFLSRRMRIAASYSLLSRTYFHGVDGVSDVSLNAPRHKAGGMIHYETANGRVETQVSWRFVGSFRVRSDIYTGEVERFGVIDASVGWQLPFVDDTRLSLTVQNLTNNRHREFVDVPEIGRLAILRLTHEL
jgi:iron complex outermembrane receptor protein